MKWYGITGSWRLTSDEVEQDVRTAVRKIIVQGDGIVSGGALNVDFFAADEALKADANSSQIKIIIPSTLPLYTAHYRIRADEGVITHEQAESLITQLTEVKKRGGLVEMHHTEMNTETYYDRNTAVVDASDVMLGFQVNGSSGVQDTLDKAAAKGKGISLKSYTID